MPTNGVVLFFVRKPSRNAWSTVGTAKIDRREQRVAAPEGEARQAMTPATIVTGRLWPSLSRWYTSIAATSTNSGGDGDVHLEGVHRVARARAAIPAVCTSPKVTARA